MNDPVNPAFTARVVSSIHSCPDCSMVSRNFPRPRFADTWRMISFDAGSPICWLLWITRGDIDKL